MKCKICDKDIKNNELEINGMHADCLADAWGELVEKYPMISPSSFKKIGD